MRRPYAPPPTARKVVALLPPLPERLMAGDPQAFFELHVRGG
jgi:hypothetical protein